MPPSPVRTGPCAQGVHVLSLSGGRSSAPFPLLMFVVVYYPIAVVDLYSKVSCSGPSLPRCVRMKFLRFYLHMNAFFVVKYSVLLPAMSYSFVAVLIYLSVTCLIQ